jgi:hypothetical protein
MVREDLIMEKQGFHRWAWLSCVPAGWVVYALRRGAGHVVLLSV